MDAVGYGTELAGRYRLEERLRSTASSDFWRAVDTTLDRTVGIRLVSPATAADAMDAARRAAVVDEPALLRVLDVAQEQGRKYPVTYVVTEFVEASSLADLVRRDGPLPADQVRSLVGQVAQVLATAAEAGLHHEALEPTSVLRTPDGAVKLEGLGVDAAAEGRNRAPGAQAARADAVALVALVYAGLTGHWPLADQVEGFAPAARVGGAPVPPADVVSGVPNDLDTLCAVTLGPVDDGPRTPAEVVENLRPWTTAGRGSDAAPTDTPEGSTMRPAGRFPVRADAVGAAVPPATGDDTAAMSRADLFPDAEPDPRPEPVLTAASRTGDRTDHDLGDNEPSDDPGYGGSRYGDAGYDARAGGGDPGYGPYYTGYGPYDTGYGPDDAGYDPDGTGYGPYDAGFGPYDAGSEGEEFGAYDDDPRPDRKPMIALAVLAVLVVVGLFLALQAIGGIGGDGDVASDPTSSAAPAPDSSAPPTSDAAPPTGPAPQISGVRTLDPQGGDGENDETAARAIDDDPSSFWRSSTYRSAEFGGLKEGLGMVVTLSEQAPVAAVTLEVGGSGGSMELRTAPGQGLEGSEVVGTADPASGTVTFELAEPVATQNLLLWWTELPDADGSFRIELSDVTVR